jgi:hypothetical protein
MRLADDSSGGTAGGSAGGVGGGIVTLGDAFALAAAAQQPGDGDTDRAVIGEQQPSAHGAGAAAAAAAQQFVPAAAPAIQFLNSIDNEGSSNLEDVLL